MQDLFSQPLNGKEKYYIDIEQDIVKINSSFVFHTELGAKCNTNFISKYLSFTYTNNDSVGSSESLTKQRS